MVTVSNDIKGLVALVVVIVLYEIVRWGVKGIIKNIKKLIDSQRQENEF